MDCIVLGAGDYHPAPCLPKRALVVAADGGLRHAEALGLGVDVLIGDMDSLKNCPPGIETLRLPVQKDDTDMLAALRLGIERGARRFHMLGGVGGRSDHTMANLQCLGWLARQGCSGFLYDRTLLWTALNNGTLRYPAQADGYLSVFAQTEHAEGVTLRGLKYPLADAVLTCDHPMGVSNEFIGRPVEITVRHGLLLIAAPSEAGLPIR